jgi:hypothetical protein
VAELQAYTKETGKIFCHTFDREGSNVALRHLLRKIFRELMESLSRDTGDVESGFDDAGSRRLGEVVMRRVVAQRRRDIDLLKGFDDVILVFNFLSPQCTITASVIHLIMAQICKEISSFASLQLLRINQTAPQIGDVLPPPNPN